VSSAPEIGRPFATDYSTRSTTTNWRSLASSLHSVSLNRR